jgi:hypothetical protein
MGIYLETGLSIEETWNKTRIKDILEMMEELMG